MFRKSVMALAATLVLGSTTLALASEFDPNLENRYPQAAVTLQSKQVALPTGQHNGTQNSSWIDRASQNFDGGGY